MQSQNLFSRLAALSARAAAKRPTRSVPYITANNLARDKYAPPSKLLTDPDAIVIGSGIGGLGIASILAQRDGAKVLLLEASAVPGGCTHCHELGGFEWNSGVDSIGDMDPSVGRGMFRPTADYITGGQLEWEKMPDVHEVAYLAGDRYEWHSDPEKNIAWVEKQFPGARVRDYYDLEAKIEASAWSWALTKLLPSWLPVSARESFYKAFGGAWRTYMGRTTAEVLRDELEFPEKLASVFEYMYGNHGRTPAYAPFAFHAVNMFHYRYGAYYPVGGPAQIPECVVPIVEAAGGQLAVSTPVKRILVEDDTAVGVELEDGRVVRAPLVVSDASAYTTFMELLDRDISERLGYPARFEEIRPSVAHLYLFLGYEEELDLPKEIIWDLPSYDIETADAKYKAERDFSSMGSYLLSPSARDPSYHERYPGRSTIVALAEAPYAWIERCRSNKQYKAKFERDLANHLEAVVHARIPQLAGKKADFRMAGVPMGCNPRAWEGSSLGLEPSADRFVKHTHWLRPETPIRNLFLTGQDSFSAGFAGSMLSARLTYSAITGDWFFTAKPNPLPPFPKPIAALLQSILGSVDRRWGGEHAVA